MSLRIKLSEIKDLNVSQCLTLDVSCENQVFDILLVCYSRGKFAAYLNRCPHTGVNLNWQPNQCFDFTEQYLVCSVHGALFQPDDGKCIYGPCLGQSLKSISLEIESGNIFIYSESLKMA